MKKLLIALFAITSVTALAETHVYGKIGADVYARYNKIEADFGKFSTSGTTHGLSGMLEVTTDVSPNLELGAGIGYIHRSSGKSKGNGTYSWKTPKYDTAPLYALAKYNFDTKENWKPYAKVDLGIAFNDSSSTLEFDWEVKENKLDVQNGVYAGAGIGVEYHNFLAELSYHITTAKAKGAFAYDDVGKEKKTTNFNGDYNNHAITLSAGYKFNF